MIPKYEIEELQELHRDREDLMADYKYAERRFKKEEANLIRRLTEQGETTGDKILDWAISKRVSLSGKGK